MMILKVEVSLESDVAIVKVEVQQDDAVASVLGSALRQDGRFVELAQARAIALARRILAEGLDVVDPAEYATAVSPPPNTPQPMPEPTTPVPMPDTQPLPIPEPPPAAPPTDSNDLPEVPW